MDKTNVRYARMGEVVVLIFPDEVGSQNFINKIEMQGLLSKIGSKNVPVTPLKPKIGTKPFQPRIVA